MHIAPTTTLGRLVQSVVHAPQLVSRRSERSHPAAASQLAQFVSHPPKVQTPAEQPGVRRCDEVASVAQLRSAPHALPQEVTELLGVSQPLARMPSQSIHPDWHVP